MSKPTESVCLPLEGKTFDLLNFDWNSLAETLDFSAMGEDPYAFVTHLKVIRVLIHANEDVELHYEYSWQLFHACRDFQESCTTCASIHGQHKHGNITFPVLPRSIDRSTMDEL